MKAAAIAAQRGHQVTLCERAARPGGQALLAQQLPGREEFGGIVDNLLHELNRAGVTLQTGVTVDAEFIESYEPDVVLIATGAVPYIPDFEGAIQNPDGGHQRGNAVITAWELLSGEKTTGSRVVVADWRSDWIGTGVAEKLAREGCDVTLCTNAALAGETLQLYTRNHTIGRLHELGVNIQTHARFYGFDDGAAYFQNTLTQAPIPFDGVDTLVLSLGHQSDNTLEEQVMSTGIRYYPLGDCVSPRTAEEAVYEGLLTGIKIV